MKIGKHLLGKYVEFVWRDPNHARVEAKNYETLPKGKEALAVWKERGIIDDLTDGVVRIEHSHGAASKIVDGQGNDHVYSWVQEELIEAITVFVPEQASQP